MLSLLVPGVHMGGGTAAAGADPLAGFLPIMGVGRAWWIIITFLGVLHGR